MIDGGFDIGIDVFCSPRGSLQDHYPCMFSFGLFLFLGWWRMWGMRRRWWMINKFSSYIVHFGVVSRSVNCGMFVILKGGMGFGV